MAPARVTTRALVRLSRFSAAPACPVCRSTSPVSPSLPLLSSPSLPPLPSWASKLKSHFPHPSPCSYRSAVEQVVVAGRRPLGGLQLGLGGRCPTYTMGQGLRRQDRHCQSQRDEGDRPERGEMAWAREHSEMNEGAEWRARSQLNVILLYSQVHDVEGSLT